MAWIAVAKPGPVEYRPWRPGTWPLIGIAAAALGLVLGLLLVMFWERGPVGGYEYHLWRWQADTLLNNVFARLGIGPDPDETAGDAAVTRYFKLTSEILAAE